LTPIDLDNTDFDGEKGYEEDEEEYDDIEEEDDEEEDLDEILKEMGTEMQVIAITHLPQIASKGNDHFKVFKTSKNEKTTTSIELLTPEERINEIAAMLSGKALSEIAISNAKSLLGVELF
jgi:DNA repair protein RecN (Recombination protein N)